MNKVEFWQMVIDEMQSAFQQGDIFCQIKSDSYQLRYENHQHSTLWDVRWHINRSNGLMTNGYIFVNGQLHVLNRPDFVLQLEDIGGQMATMKKMMTV